MLNDQLLNQPLVSVIVITYNSEKFVLETLDSIYVQSYPNIELIITDDFSSDNTVQICKTWLDEHSERFVNSKLVTVEKNSGISPNCNRGVAASNGQWIKIIAGDDCLERNTIEAYVQHIAKNPEITCLYSNVCEYDDVFDVNYKRPLRNMKDHRINYPGIIAQEQFSYLLRENPVWAAAIITRKDVLDKIGWFNEKYAFFEDRPMLLALTKAGHKIHYLDIVGAKYRRHSESVQKAKSTVFMTRLKQNQQDFFINECLPFFSKQEQVAMLYSSRVNNILKNVFNNKKNILVKAISRIMHVFPKVYLAINNKR